MSVLGEYLHARTLVAAVAYDELASRADHSHLAGVPELPFFLPGYAKVKLVCAGLVEHLLVFI